MEKPTPRHIVVIGTGGTISALADSAAEQHAYRTGEVSVAALVAGMPKVPGFAVNSEQLAQIDSKDMDGATWCLLAERVAAHLARTDVAAIVITHGTDTLEETAWFLQRLLVPAKPVVFTGAMRPASSDESDGPRNLADALLVALALADEREGRGGVLAVLAGHVHAAADVRKTHPTRLDAFTSGDAGALGRVADGHFVRERPTPPAAPAIGLAALPVDAEGWPYVAIVTGTALAEPRTVQALVAAGCRGLVVASTGNGTLHHALEAALDSAVASGVAVLRATRCIDGEIVEGAPSNARRIERSPLTPAKARVELIVRLLAEGVRPRRA